MTARSRTTNGTRSRGKRRGRIPVVLILSLTLLAAAGVILTFELVTFSQREDRIPSDVTVGGVRVGGLTQTEAVVRWEEAYSAPVIVYYGDNPIRLEPNIIDFRPNSETLLASALSSGEGGADFWIRFWNHLSGQEVQRGGASIAMQADYQRGLLRAFLEDVATRYDRDPGRAGFDIATLSVYSGNQGSTLDVDAAMVLVGDALMRSDNRVVQLPIGDSSASQPSMDTLRQLIIDYLDTQGFPYDGQTTVASVYIQDLQTGEEINLLGDVAMSAASTMKVPIMIDFYRSLDREPTQDEAFILANSLLCSRNSSSNLLMQFIGGGNVLAGVASVTQTAQYSGARNTYIAARFIEGVAGETFGAIAAPRTEPNPNFNTEPDPFNQTTAEDLGTLYSMIYDCANQGSGLMVAYPDGEFTQTECRQMLELTSANDLQRLLQGGLPEGVRISHKNGWLDAVVGDAGVVYSPNGRNYVISVFLWEDVDFQDFERLWPLLEGVSRATWNYFNPEDQLFQPRTDLPRTAQDCEGNYLPPSPALTNLNDINAWRR